MDLAMAQRLVDRRKAAGLSQEALAAQLGVSRQAVSKWERSESSPDTDNLIALAALYGVSLDELLYGEAASDVDTSADDDVDANNYDETEGTESSTEHVDPDGKPLVDISLARGIHVVDPNKGEEVHVGWSGIHVANERKGEEVHVGPGGLHIDTLEDDGHSVHTNADGTVTIDGETFQLERGTRQARPSWQAFPHQDRSRMERVSLSCTCRPRLSRARHHLRHVGYGALSGLSDSRLRGDGRLIDRHHLSKLIGVVYATAAIAWFLYMWLCLAQPHPAWVILITIPFIEALMCWCRKQWKRRKQA